MQSDSNYINNIVSTNRPIHDNFETRFSLKIANLYANLVRITTLETSYLFVKLNSFSRFCIAIWKSLVQYRLNRELQKADLQLIYFVERSEFCRKIEQITQMLKKVIYFKKRTLMNPIEIRKHSW